MPSTATSLGVTLAEIELPAFDLPRVKPEIPAETYVARVAAVEARLAALGLEAVAIYGDREHFATTQYLTGFDPRYEESILLIVPGRTPTILVGNESVAYASGTPYPIEVVRQSKLSLAGQPDPDDIALSTQLRDAGIGGSGAKRVGVVGWKAFSGTGTAGWFDVPHFIVAQLQALAEVVPAGDIFIGEEGLRLVNDVDQIAYFEFAASHGSQALRRLLGGIQAGMTELEASSLMQPIMLPFNYHPTMLSGPVNTRYGVASPGSRVMELGDRVCAGIGYWGSNTARAGYLAHDAAEIPAHEHDYVDAIVAPYYATAAAWLETIRIGLTAGELYDVTASRIGGDFHNVFLNPGHFIHLDEWPMSPVKPGATLEFRSGNAIQLDIIPAPATHQNSQIEDGIALADATLRAELAAKHPEAWGRIQARRTMLSETFGIELHEEVLPLSNTIGYLPPFWLAPNMAMVKA